MKPIVYSTAYKIKCAITAFCCIVVSYYCIYNLLTEAIHRAKYDRSDALLLFLFFVLSIAAYSIVNTIYYLWFISFSGVAIQARKRGFKMGSIFIRSYDRTINENEFSIYFFGNIDDRNVLFRMELGLMIDLKSKKAEAFDVPEEMTLYGNKFDEIYELNMGKTLVYKKTDYFYEINTKDYFKLVNEIIDRHRSQ